MRQKIWLTWNDNNPSWAYPIRWDVNSYLWNDVAVFIEIAEEVLTGGGGPLGHIVFQKGLTGSDVDQLKRKFSDQNVETFIKVVCKINNLNYEERKNRKTKPIVTIKEIEKAFNKVTSVKVSLVKKDI